MVTDPEISARALSEPDVLSDSTDHSFSNLHELIVFHFLMQASCSAARYQHLPNVTIKALNSDYNLVGHWQLPGRLKQGFRNNNTH